jgi:hypothetical protein
VAEQIPEVKMVPVDADLFEAVGYTPKTRMLFIKFRPPAGAVSYQNVPGFRYDGLLAAPRKDAYFETFIQNRFIEKPAILPLHG